MDIDEGIRKSLIKYRRDFHKYPESGWTEFRTSCIVAKTLNELGFDVSVGKEVIDTNYVMGRPGDKEIKEHMERAILEGADPDVLDKTDGYTGVVGLLDTEKPGPTIAVRFDMDANDLEETDDSEHWPNKLNFRSVHKNVMHACGHDAHTSIGLGLAEILARNANMLKGRFKLIFQPAEEGVRGAYPMVKKGIADDVDYFLACHVGFGCKGKNAVVINPTGYLSTTKFDVYFQGRAAHAGEEPNEGKNALLAAATAALNLHAIAPHRDGATRINVGFLEAGTGRNVVPDRAFLKAETRGETEEIDNYMYEKAISIINGAAQMYNIKSDVKIMGKSISGHNSDDLASLLYDISSHDSSVEEVIKEGNAGGSEDATYFMKRVQELGGSSLYFQARCPIKAGHHNSRFDIDEDIMYTALRLYLQLIERLLKAEG